MNRKYLSRILVLFLFLVYWAVSLRRLTVVPPVYEDEPWQASTGWKIATEGVFGSDLFAGFYGMEAHYYGYLPVHPFLLAAVFKLAGLGLFQARFEPVVLGLLILALTYALGKRLFRPPVGLLAVFLLLFTRTTGLTPSQHTGILFMDVTRIVRYDTAVPFFALGALLLYTGYSNNELRIMNNELRIFRYAFIGFLTSLAALSHLYGLFWFVVFFLVFVWHKATLRQVGAYVLGFSLPWLVYLLYVLSGWSDWVGQTQDYAPRFELFNPGWYWQNLINEPRRYGTGLGTGSWFRPGLWAAAVVVPLSLLALGRRAAQGSKQAQTLLVPIVVIPILFGLFIYLKLPNYLITAAPLLALVMAWGLVNAGQLAGRIGRLAPSEINRRLRRLRRLKVFIDRVGRGWSPSILSFSTACLLLLIGLEGASRLVILDRTAQTTTPYSEYAAEIQAHLPPDGRILGLHNYWFNFEAWEYRSWFVPILQTNPDYWRPPLTVEAALDGVDPTVVLIDRRMRELFEADPETAEAVYEWMAGNGFERTATVEDKTYGRMDIYLRAAEDE